MSVMDRFRAEPGERVLVVPQSYAHLMRLGDPNNIVGKKRDEIEQYPDAGTKKYEYGQPYWDTATPYGMPSIGYGLMVVRDGKLALGPEHFDSGD
jgi:hypothetical protein